MPIVAPPISTQRGDQRRLAADAIAVVTEERGADRARHEADEVGREGEQRRRRTDRIRERTSAGRRAPPRRRTGRSRTTRSSCRRPRTSRRDGSSADAVPRRARLPPLASPFQPWPSCFLSSRGTRRIIRCRSRGLALCRRGRAACATRRTREPGYISLAQAVDGAYVALRAAAAIHHTADISAA